MTLRLFAFRVLPSDFFLVLFDFKLAFLPHPFRLSNPPTIAPEPPDYPTIKLSNHRTIQPANFKVLHQTTLRLDDFGIIMRDSKNAIYSFLRTLTSQPPALNAVGAKHPLSSRAASPSPLVPLSVWHIGTFGPFGTFGSLAHCRLLVPCLSPACLPISRKAHVYRDIDKLGYQFFPVLLTPSPKARYYWDVDTQAFNNLPFLLTLPLVQLQTADPAFSSGMPDPAFSSGMPDPAFSSGMPDPAFSSGMPLTAWSCSANVHKSQFGV